MNRALGLSETVTFIAGVSLMDVETLLSLIVLAISAVVGLINLAFKVREILKDGKIDEAEKAELEKQIEELQDQLKEIKK